MRPTGYDGNWDLTAVIDLIYTLSASKDKGTDPYVAQPIDSSKPTTPVRVDDNKVHQLGNFDRLWQFLGQPLDANPPTIIPLSDSDKEATAEEDGNVEVVNGKGVRWRDEVEGADLEDNDDEIGSTGGLTELSKAQRKKDRRRKRQQELQTKSITRRKTPPVSSDNESEGELARPQRSNDRRAIIDNILHGTPLSQISKDAMTTLSSPQSRYPLRSKNRTGDHKLPIPKPAVIPTWVGAQILAEQDALTIATTNKVRLISMIYNRFVDERQYLSSLGITNNIPCGINGDVPDGVHVFVDASNIMIGFHDALKISRGLSIFSRIGRQPFSFHNFSLVLERGRPVAKRVLVGSDNFPAIQEAKLLGYETNILDRVHKAKELTPRQKKYRNGNGTSGASSGSETNATHAPEKWVEQAVDEILHLKILESVVDAHEPSIIVLATGDAAEAEYSGGFLKMVERALQKGWKVELVSFRRNISSAYKRNEFRSKWGQSFKIIELDDFVGELLGV